MKRLLKIKILGTNQELYESILSNLSENMSHNMLVPLKSESFFFNIWLVSEMWSESLFDPMIIQVGKHLYWRYLFHTDGL